MTGLALAGVEIALDGRVLIPRLDLAVAPGEVVTVMGPSGSGKSTLLAFIGGFIDPVFRVSGQVLIDGADVTRRPPEARRAGILFQDDLLFPHLSVGQNLAFGLVASVRGRAARRRVIETALAQADLAGFFDRDPATLSGGQRARVALLRTLLAEPRTLLLDEPFNRLDSHLRDDIRRFVFGHARERSLPTLLVTHDADDARAAGGRTVRLGA
ncbi:ATP-binding cassette domain-containing protein [Blastochloris tepida]|uniref:ABC transporter ATP-binding protein n=1 Tax=Blastochloris tepida TaxID=2233851 RepID=A0A348FVV5_9HYPH|nr:ATP-binding cassette domain-containing protein [Blastochloris tepida]BBF91438.1 ABC transporter ATP-binding protein [Blastochloris tepida]